jgi:hypothetical protein
MLLPRAGANSTIRAGMGILKSFAGTETLQATSLRNQICTILSLLSEPGEPLPAEV